MAAVPDREAEVRKALRWLKDLWRRQRIPPERTAILARSLTPYRPFLESISREYGLVIRVQGGLPLAENPLIDAVLALLRAALEGRQGLGWRELVSLWRSPYFSWEPLYTSAGIEFSPEGHARSCQLLVEVAHWGRVVGTYPQWEEVFGELQVEAQARVDADDDAYLEPGSISARIASQLWELFKAYLDLISPLDGLHTMPAHIAWLEGLLGITSDDDLEQDQGLGVPNRIRQGEEHFQQRDWAAFQALTDILRAKVWASALLGEVPVSFQEFLADLIAAVEKATYQPLEAGRPAVTCADVTEVRGVPFRAVALLGLGEGEFPATIQEDPFLRDQERSWLKDQAGVSLQLSTASAEAEFFYEAVCRAEQLLLVTRPRIADNGAAWQPSPYWEELMRCLDLVPELETSSSRPLPGQAGSLAEYFQVLASQSRCAGPAWDQAADRWGEYARGILRSGRVLDQRASLGAGQASAYNGGLQEWGQSFRRRFPDRQVWSCSRLESYQSCPFQFFTGSVLGFEKPEPPREGLDARQLGNLYHQILERLYGSLPEDYSLENALAALPGAAEEVFRDAPAREGFRETAWWDYTQQEILGNLQRSLIVLESIDPRFRFFKAEQRFGISGSPEPELEVRPPSGGSFLLRGFIDRVDRSPQGTLRVIDYKTSGSYGFTNRAVAEGKKLQLPLYALAAQDALDLGRVEEGFYFHVRSAQPSSLKLASYREGHRQGPEAASGRAADRAWEAIEAIREGSFQPKSPADGCPSYCPAAAFCWNYQPGKW